MKIKNLIVILALAILFGGVAVQNVRAATKPMNCTDPTFPGCSDEEKAATAKADASAPATVGNSCGTTADSFCEAGSFFCSTGRTRNFSGKGCVSGAICCKNDVKTGSTVSTPGLGDGATPVLKNDGGALPVNQNVAKETAVIGTGVYIPTAQETGLPGGTIQGILKNLLVWLLEIVGVVALIGFVIAGIQYVMAAGDEKLAETAKKNMTYAIIGIVVVLSSFVVIQAIDYALRAQYSF